MRNSNNKGSRSNINKHELVNGESSSNAIDAPYVCLSFVSLFTIFIIVVRQKLVLQQSKNVTAKCTETLSPPPSIKFSLLALNSYFLIHIQGYPQRMRFQRWLYGLYLVDFLAFRVPCRSKLAFFLFLIIY